MTFRSSTIDAESQIYNPSVDVLGPTIRYSPQPREADGRPRHTRPKVKRSDKGNSPCIIRESTFTTTISGEVQVSKLTKYT